MREGIGAGERVVREKAESRKQTAESSELPRRQAAGGRRQ
jgi:hypothetical protein